MTPKPTWELLLLRCETCGHEWDDWQPSHVHVEVWVAALESHHCPECGASQKLLIRMGKADDPKPEGDGARDGGDQARGEGFGP